MLISCSNQPPKSYIFYLFIDITEPEFRNANDYLPDLYSILEEAKLDTSDGGNNSLEIKIFKINDISENRSKTIFIEQGIPGWFGDNKLDRSDLVVEFVNKLKNEMTSFLSHNNFDRSQSKIYQNVCRELNTLHIKDFNNKYVVIYSDMLENSSLFSLYSVDQDFSDPTILKEMENTLKNDCECPPLKDINIHIIASRTVENDPLVNNAQHFWTNYFHSKNANVYFDSELILSY